MLVSKELIIEAKKTLGKKATFIISKDLKLEKFDEINLKSLCPFHNEDTPSFIWNQNLNNFHCFSCQKNYDIIDHYMSFDKMTFLDAVQKLFKETDTEFYFGEKGIKTHKNYIYPTYDKNENRKEVEDYLQLRKISKETLDYCDVQQDDNHNIVFNFYDSNDVLTLVKYRPAKKIEHGETKTWCQVGAGHKPLLFNMNHIDTTKSLLITEGEIDCLASIESGYTNSVSIPLGAGNTGWIEENFEWLEQFDKIIVWSDNDDAGIKMRKEVCHRLGVYRTLYVDLPQTIKDKNGKEISVKDTNEVLFFFGKDKVIDFIENAQEFPIDGVTDLYDIEDFDLEKAPGLYSGLDSIDNIIYKFLFGSVVLVTGKRGSGKSTLVNQIFISEALNQGYNVFVYSDEIDSKLLKSWIELNMAGPEKVKMKSVAKEGATKFIHIIDAQARKEIREWYKERVSVYTAPTNDVDYILDKAIATTRKHGTKIWVIDNLMTLNIGDTVQDIWLKQKEFIVKLNKLAIQYNVLAVLVAHPRKLQTGIEVGADDVAGAAALGNVAPYIMSVRRIDDKDKKGEKQYNKSTYKSGKEPIEEDAEITFLKNRYTGKLGNARIFFDYDAYRFYKTPSELWKRYKWNNDKTPVPTHDRNKHSEIPEEME